MVYTRRRSVGMGKTEHGNMRRQNDQERKRTPSTIPHQNAISDVHNQAMVAIRGKTFNAMSLSSAERANRCAEVRLNHTKKHIDFMQHLDLVRLNRDRVEMIDRLEKFKRSLVRIKAERGDLFRRESIPNGLDGKAMRMNEEVCLPVFSKHSPRFSNARTPRYLREPRTKLTPINVVSIRKPDSMRKPDSDPLLGSDKRRHLTLSQSMDRQRELGGRLPVSQSSSYVPRSVALGGSLANPSLQVVTFKRSYESKGTES